MIKAYWHNSKSNNFGDTLTPIILEHFLKQPVKLMPRNNEGKIICVGSVLTALRAHDIVWGAGLIRDLPRRANFGVKVLAVRGPKTLKHLGLKGPTVFGDPAILLPLIYDPVVEKKHKVGVIPHSIEKEIDAGPGEYRINIDADWKTVIEEVKSCERIISSSLHGIVCAEAYGIPATWAVFTNKVIGGEFKFQDYFLGTGRSEQKPFTPLPPIPDLKGRQDALLEVLFKHYDLQK